VRAARRFLQIHFPETAVALLLSAPFPFLAVAVAVIPLLVNLALLLALVAQTAVQVL
jgi:hypothetical protein